MTTITTVAELEALPVGSVVLGKDIGHVRRPVAERIESRIDPEALWSVDGVHYYMTQTALSVLDHEGTVLYRPDAPPTDPAQVVERAAQVIHDQIARAAQSGRIDIEVHLGRIDFERGIAQALADAGLLEGGTDE